VTFAVTGANGFLGVHIIHHLLETGHKVFAIKRANSSLSEYNLVKNSFSDKQINYENLTWVDCELFDMEGLHEVFDKADYVMHLAGSISYLKKDLTRLLEINAEYTANVVNVALKCEVKKLLYCSSIAAISKTTDGSSVKEDRDWDNEVPHSNYGYTKYLGECEVWRAAEEGLPVVVINPGVILGMGDWTKGSNKLFKNAQTNFPFYSHGITGWVGVVDVASIALQLCLSEITKERFVITSENLSYKQISDYMTRALGTKKPRIEIKGLLYKIAYAIVAAKEILGFSGMLSKETVRASIAQNYFDNSKIKKALDFEFEGMEDVVREVVSTKKAQANA
jgi:dihydroflavonol-4-reductase